MADSPFESVSVCLDWCVCVPESFCIPWCGGGEGGIIDWEKRLREQEEDEEEEKEEKRVFLKGPESSLSPLLHTLHLK